MPKVIEAIQNYLTAKKPIHNGPDLLERFLKYSGSLETQVNVSAGKGWQVDGKRSTFTDGLDEWWNIRIPKNANSDPTFKDYSMTWPLDLHAESIGCTGWDWKVRRSRWLGFDFDSITGHAVGVGISSEKLEEVKEAACALPWVEVRRSTGGNGLHLYVLFDEEGVPTANHTVHAALGRTILGMMSSETGFDFASQIDACGGNMWIWARKMTVENQGLALVKAATTTLSEADIPTNWKDNIEVIERKTSKIRVEGLDEKSLDPFEALASSRQVIPRDAKHKAICDELSRMKGSVVWIPDYNLLQTHTGMLQKLMDDKKAELKLVGFFRTNSKGSNWGQANCFLFPLPDGAWKVYRFSQNVAEDSTWEQGNGWTTCHFNKAPNLKVAARAMGGIEDADKGGFVFDTIAKAQETVQALGQKLELPEAMKDRPIMLKSNKDGRLIVKIDKIEGDNPDSLKTGGWLGKKTFWSKIFETVVEDKNDFTTQDFDEQIRALISTSGERAGWMMRHSNGSWNRVPPNEATRSLLAEQYTKQDAEVITAQASKDAWMLVNIPFQPEYPGNRQWNNDAAQYRYKPAELTDDEVPHHPHWNKVLRHCGQDLDDALKDLDWAIKSNIKTGADYLLTWAACMLREPYEKLPYLFFYGEQNSGKSIYHEALALLMTKGVAAADRALTNTNDFNGELANAVLAYIEEKDISLSPGAYNKLKDWVTGEKLWIRKMRTDAYPQINTLHFVQTANEREACTIKAGDTRITMFFVPSIQDEIPKPILLERLREEAPHFMRTIMDLQLPAMIGRLRLPVVNTDNKRRAEAAARTAFEDFVATECFYVPGNDAKTMVTFTDFYNKFISWLPIEDQGEWSSKQKVAKALPMRFPYGKYSQGIRYVGNLMFEDKKSPPDAGVWIEVSGRLKLQKAAKESC